MSDRREDILYLICNAQSEDCRTRKEDIQIALTLNPDIDRIYLAMDEYMRECCLELLQFIAENEVEGSTKNKAAKTIEDPVFYYKGEWVTKEWLFEEFL